MQILIEAIPSNEDHALSAFRGYVALDDIGLYGGGDCAGLCSFEGGFCDWVNSQMDDFDWTLVS